MTRKPLSRKAFRLAWACKPYATRLSGRCLKIKQAPPQGRGSGPCVGGGVTNNFFSFCKKSITLSPMFNSYPYEPRKLEATEVRLEAIKTAAKLGLKGDALAIAAGMLPTEYRQLCQLDPAAEFAELLGRAEGEREASQQLHAAAASGDAKAALAILQHQHGWVAKQQLSIDIEQRISVTQALEDAQRRVIEGVFTDVTAPKELSNNPQFHVKPNKQKQQAA
jgi:hypothetical protein